MQIYFNALCFNISMPYRKFKFKYDYNIKNKFKCDVGYSGHESTVSPSIIAFLLGANYIERHITLDRSMWGTDQSASLSKTGMETFIKYS